MWIWGQSWLLNCIHKNNSIDVEVHLTEVFVILDSVILRFYSNSVCMIVIQCILSSHKFVRKLWMKSLACNLMFSHTISFLRWIRCCLSFLFIGCDCIDLSIMTTLGPEGVSYTEMFSILRRQSSLLSCLHKSNSRDFGVRFTEVFVILGFVILRFYFNSVCVIVIQCILNSHKFVRKLWMKSSVCNFGTELDVVHLWWFLEFSY